MRQECWRTAFPSGRITLIYEWDKSRLLLGVQEEKLPMLGTQGRCNADKCTTVGELGDRVIWPRNCDQCLEAHVHHDVSASLSKPMYIPE